MTQAILANGLGAVAAIGHHALSGNYNIFEVYNRGRAEDLFTIFSNGNAWLKGELTEGSSREYKEDIQPLSFSDYKDTLAKIENIDVVTFRWKDEEDGRLRIGIIAEDAPEEIVDKEKKGIQISSFLSFLLAATKAQNQEIEELRTEIEELREIIKKTAL